MTDSALRRIDDRPIYLVSMAGFPNYGDEVIAAAWLRFLARTRPETEVWLDTRYPGSAAALFADLHPRLRTTDGIFRAVEDARHGSRRDIGSIIRDLGTPLYDLQIHALRDAGTIHLLGGGFVNAQWPENQLIVRAMQAAAEVSGARLIATGQGLMPDVGERFAGFEHVSVRDVESAQLLGIGRGADDALLGMQPWLGTARGAEPPAELVLCIQNDAQDEGVFERNLDFARRAAAAFGIAREQTRYVEAIPGNDHAGFDALRDVVADDGFIPFSAAWRDGLPMGPHQVWVTTRFHHHLIASGHGARGVALAGQAGYYDVKHRSVAQLGSNWKVSHGTEEPPALSELAAPQPFGSVISSKAMEAAAIYR